MNEPVNNGLQNGAQPNEPINNNPGMQAPQMNEPNINGPQMQEMRRDPTKPHRARGKGAARRSAAHHPSHRCGLLTPHSPKIFQKNAKNFSKTSRIFRRDVIK